jgi:hypothetical protein
MKVNLFDFECAFLRVFFLIVIDMTEGRNRAFSVQPDYAYMFDDIESSI